MLSRTRGSFWEHGAIFEPIAQQVDISGLCYMNETVIFPRKQKPIIIVNHVKSIMVQSQQAFEDAYDRLRRRALVGCSHWDQYPPIPRFPAGDVRAAQQQGAHRSANEPRISATEGRGPRGPHWQLGREACGHCGCEDGPSHLGKGGSEEWKRLRRWQPDAKQYGQHQSGSA